ncbi:MAG: hypothetical protein HY060_14075 [Proteobacteria bacterium]|nr:hypothetical protein [Pseudomonadota bacterium]
MPASASAPALGRDTCGRFLPGCSGNPAGKPLGRRHDATILREGLRGADIDAAVRIIQERLAKGEFAAARFVIGRLDPKPKLRATLVEIAVPPEASLLERCQAVFAAMARGDITPGEAVEAARVIEIERKLLTTVGAATALAAAAEPAEPAASLNSASICGTEQAQPEPTVPSGPALRVVPAAQPAHPPAMPTAAALDGAEFLKSPCIPRTDEASPPRRGWQSAAAMRRMLDNTSPPAHP